MDTLQVVIVVACITGAGVVTGLLFAFSNFALQALADLPSDKGMFAMQRINARILNPLFFVLFFGTPFLCILILIISMQSGIASVNAYLLFGAILYLAGPFGITVMFNVPLNNLLARTDLTEADMIWPWYRQKWQRWNHIRTFLGVISNVFLSLGLAGL